jgi:hypothetical protein
MDLESVFLIQERAKEVINYCGRISEMDEVKTLLTLKQRN